ncbi:hypothetical protein RUM44_010135 [Polyplax serrata]|uniref:Peptidase C45 hydrolase domain-containing protein n=1 Tax=Polyplax serrata TaxID=468196 RepID=A0ABR1AUQ8_POLSC
MPIEKIQRRNNVPFIYARGTHYDVGFDIGTTFRHMIQSYLEAHGPLNKIYLPLWETAEGKKAYESTLEVVKKNFPQYLEEIRGTAEGADVPFHKLFLLHMDEILSCSVENKTSENENGCSTICCNYKDQVFLAHNEDALAETHNHFYFVSAHIIEKEPMGRWKVKEEKFTSLCYAGTLPGFTMSYNHHGLVFSVNVIRAKNMQAGKTPRTILTRALLAASTVQQVEDILKDNGCGIGDGVNINFIFPKGESPKLFYNAEVGPSKGPDAGSLIDIVPIGPGEKLYHCNRYLRLQCKEAEDILFIGSKHREAVMNFVPMPKSCTEALKILADETDKEYPVFRNKGKTQTIATVKDFLLHEVYRAHPPPGKGALQLSIVAKRPILLFGGLGGPPPGPW